MKLNTVHINLSSDLLFFFGGVVVLQDPKPVLNLIELFNTHSVIFWCAIPAKIAYLY
jgi:hypothetical protein